MEEVTLVIKLPKDKYDAIINKYDIFSAEMKEWGLNAIKNGIVLPNEHEDSRDANTTLNELHYASSRSVKNQMHRVQQTQALIPVDKENSDAYND